MKKPAPLSEERAVATGTCLVVQVTGRSRVVEGTGRAHRLFARIVESESGRHVTVEVVDRAGILQRKMHKCVQTLAQTGTLAESRPDCAGSISERPVKLREHA